MTISASDTSAFSFLDGGGEMGARIRQSSWSDTPLGPPQSWSHSLRSAIGRLLSASTPMALFWGAELVLVYNDAYRPLLGKTPAEPLGRPGRDACGARWEGRLHAALDGVMRTGEPFQERNVATLIERDGREEQAYFAFSYEPVRADAGSIAGVVCVATDVTAAVVSERRLALLRELAEKSATASTEREACARAMEAFQGHPDFVCAAAYLDERAITTPGALDQLSAMTPELVKTLPLPASATAPAGGARLVIGVDPRRPFDGAFESFVGLVAQQLGTTLMLARARLDSARALGRKSEQYVTLLEQAPLGIYVLDAELKFLELNPIARKVFGAVAGGVIGREFLEIARLVWPEPAALETARIFRRALETGAPYSFNEGGGVRLGGELAEYYEWRVTRISLPSGGFGLVCYFREVTAQRAAFAAKAYLAAIVDSADDAILAKDLNGVIQSCNAAAERVFGYSRDELVGMSVRSLIPPERQREEDEILERLRAGERVDHFETVRLRKDGRRITIALTISPVRDQSGRIIGASKIVRDITALKQAEQERLRLLQENAAVTETLNNVGALVASDLDRSKVVQAVTDKATEMTGAEFGAFFYNVLDERGESYAPYTISGVPREMFSKFPMPRNTEIFEPTFKGTGVLRSDDVTKEPGYGHNAPYYGMPPGHLPVRSYLAVPVKGRAGDVIGGLFFGHSEVGRFGGHHERIAVGIAAWAALALENARLYASVQEASRLKDDFLASLSHELRTPLNAILGYARMLQSGLVAPDKTQRAVDTIVRNATSLTQIVEDVLDISRIVSGKIRLNVQVVDLPVVVRNAIDVIAPAADAKGVRLETIVDPQAGPVSGDPERLQQVLWNLLSNGVKFTKRGGKVQVRLERVDSHIELIVSDTGIGISQDFLPHVFERFRQAEGGTTRERGGLGLGLSIARQLTELHGGAIRASSAGVDQGATFCVSLPLMSVQPGRADGPGAHPSAPSTPTGTRGTRLDGVHVLAVDDEPDALALVSEVLEAAGARLTPARSAEEALAKLTADLPHVVVTDLGMPRVDGFALIERLRHHEDPKVREIPAAALTAYARSEDRMKVLDAGFQIHLAKPIDPAELVATVASLAKRVVIGRREG